MSLLARAHLRHLWRERWQALLALIGIAIGVAVVVAVDLVNASSREAMQLARAELSGRATHLITGPGERLPEAAWQELRMDWRRGEPPLDEFSALAPLVLGRARLSSTGEGEDQPVRVVGIDPVADARVRDRVPAAGAADTGAGFDVARLLTDPRAVVVDAATIRALGLMVGDPLQVTTDAGTRRMELIGEIAAGDRRVARGLLLADIATAQELLGEQGWLTRIDLVREQAVPGSPPLMLLERLFPGLVVRSSGPVVAELDGGLRIESLADRGADTRALASAFQLDLAALGLLAIVVGLFLIHGTLRYSVLRRQRQFGRLRALGVAPAELRRMILLEAAVLGVLGVLVGLLLGRILAGSLLGLVSTTLEGIYDQVAIGALSPDPVPWLKGALVGFGGALAAAWPVARRAARVSPLELQMGGLSTPAGARHPLMRALAWGLVAALALLPGTGHVGGLVAIAALLMLGAVLAPVLIAAFLGGLARLSGRAPVGLRMLLREASRGLGRSGVASSALVVAIATAIGMGLMVESFRGSVEQWLEARLAAPLYLRLPDGAAGPLPAELLAAVEAGSSGWVERHAFPDRVEGRPVTVALVRTHGRVEVRPGPLTGPTADASGAMLSEPLARALGVPLDPDPDSASVRIRTGEGARRVPVTGVFREYGGGRGTLVLPHELWPSPPPGVRILELHGVADPAALAQRLVPLLPAGAELRRNDEILARSLEVFDRTFRVTGVLQTLAGLVAAIGLFGALSALALERRALFGVLRALGVPRAMPALQSLVESLLIAALAGLLAMPLGLLVAAVLVEVVNVRAFGWSMDLALSPALLLQALLVALAAGALAALGPALRLWRTPPVVMLGDTRALG